MEPTTPPTPTPTPPEPVVELIRTQRQGVGYALTAIAAALLIVAVMLAMKSNRMPTTTAATADEKGEKDLKDALKPETLDAPAVVQASRNDYLGGAIAAAWAMAVVAAGAAYLIVALPKPTEAEQRREARVLILAVGGKVGAVLILFGMWYFYRWSDSLLKWLDRGELKEAKFALYPILMIVIGGGLMMLSVQPARAEERNNTTIRRLVYGSNFGLTALILFVVLVIANAVVAMRLPNKLDTTNTGFYTLHPQTVQLLASLDTPIRAYAIFQGGDPITEDVKRLLSSAQDANPSRFQVRFLSPALDAKEIVKLKNDYPLAEMSTEGVLLVAGEDGAERKRSTFIREEEFKRDPQGRRVEAFNGEPKLLRELMFLAENKNRPKVYFTQSSGELALSGARGVRSAAAFAEYLRKNYFDVQPLTFELGAAAKIPDDAAVVVVADPSNPLPPAAAEAIAKFMDNPRPDGKKGKLVVLAGAQAGADGKPLKLGIEPTLAAFGVRLSERFVYAVPSEEFVKDEHQGARFAFPAISEEAKKAGHPVAMAFAKIRALPLVDARPLTVAEAPKVQPVRLLTATRRQTWQEAVVSPDPLKTWIELNQQAERIDNSKVDQAEKDRQFAALRQEKQISSAPRDFAALVSDGTVARVAVYGCGWMASDEVVGRDAQTTPFHFDMLGATLDWIRERPPLPPISEKPYTNYKLAAGYDVTRILYLPLAVGLMAVVGLGAGVWVIRRK